MLQAHEWPPNSQAELYASSIITQVGFFIVIIIKYILGLLALFDFVDTGKTDTF